MSPNFLKIIFSELQDQNDTINEFEYRNKPFSNSQVFCASIESFKQLTHGSDVKTVYQLNLSLKDIEHDFLPGDTIAILPENEHNEVNELLIRLNIIASCDKKYNLEILKDTTKKNAVIPKHLPPNSTLTQVFLKHIDIRAKPKKVFLKNLIKYTKDSLEKQKLEMICSPTGSKEYAKLLTEHRTLLSFLNAFPTCLPPVTVILEHSTPLNPRYFSIASSPLEKNNLSIIFSVVEFESGLKGVCTGWLQKILRTNTLQNEKVKVPLYFRKPGDFRFTSIEKPSILVATGTGIAPFRETWLFYGCRYSEKDYLCQDELENHLKDGVLTKLYPAFSRDTEKKVYVQQKILDYGEEVLNLILDKEASILICGDAKTIVRDIREVFVQLFMEYKNVDRLAADDIVNNLVTSKRYLIDSWI